MFGRKPKEDEVVEQLKLIRRDIHRCCKAMEVCYEEMCDFHDSLLMSRSKRNHKRKWERNHDSN